MGGQILMGQTMKSLESCDSGWKLMHEGVDGTQQVLMVDEVISSAPLRDVTLHLAPRPAGAVLHAAQQLRYRDFLTVVLIVKAEDLFADNWIYIHEPGVKVGHIQNFKSWSPEMVPDASCSCYGLEYFCFEGDGLWPSSDEDLIELAKQEFAAIGLCSPEKISDGCVMRQAKAYPVYDDEYARHVGTLRTAIAGSYPGLHVVGRNGMHKYNNQDHAMMTAMLCVENIAAGQPLYDLWQVNEDAAYHEVGQAGVERALASGLRQVPMRRPASVV